MSKSDPLILQFQRDLFALGFDPGAVDGQSGPNTRGAAHRAGRRFGSDWTGGEEIPKALIEDVARRAELGRIAKPIVEPPPNYLDLRKFASPDWKEHDRPWAQIFGATLHQTGCPMSEKPSRWYGLSAHYGITYLGQIYQIRSETEMGWHAQGLSHHEVGIEIAGFFNGIEGDSKTTPNDGGAGFKVQSVTDAQIEACKNLLRYLKKLVEAHGGKFTDLHPHRVATNTRQPDPGSKVWQTIALPMMEELQLSDGGPGFVLGKGMPIPEKWDEARKGIKY